MLCPSVCCRSDEQTGDGEAPSADHADVLAGSHHGRHCHRAALLLDVPTPQAGLPAGAGAHTGETRRRTRQRTQSEAGL